MTPQKECFLSFALMTFLLIGCKSDEIVVPTAFNENDLSNVSYNFVGLDQEETVVILGQLNFAEIEGLNISGKWGLETWGEQPQFPHLPAEGAFKGFIHSDVAIINIDLPETEAFLGLVVEGFSENRLVGTLRLLPESKFSGRFEAIRK